MRHVVLGAGPIGTALADHLRGVGEDVSLFSIMGTSAYDMPGTTPSSVSGVDRDALLSVCDGADVIYLCLNAHYVDWYALFPPRLDAAIDVAADVGARLVYHDDVYLYGDVDGRPLTEDMAAAGTTRKGRLRADMADTLLAAVHAGRLTGAIGRSADVYGPGALSSAFNSTLGQRHFYPLLAGKWVSVLGDIDQPHTYSYVHDVSVGLATLGVHDAAVGEAWHLPSAPTLSHRELLSIAFEQAALPAKIRGSRASVYFVRLIGRFQDDVNEVAEMLYLFTKPLDISHDKYREAFGASSTPHAQALNTTLAWYRANPLGTITPSG